MGMPGADKLKAAASLAAAFASGSGAIVSIEAGRRPWGDGAGRLMA